MKKYIVVLALLLALDLGSRLISIPKVHAQGKVPYWFTVESALHTVCPVTANVTTYCYADDGEWISLHGAAWVATGGPGPMGPAGKDGAPGRDSTVPGPPGPQGIPGTLPKNFALGCGPGTGTIFKGFVTTKSCNTF